MAKLPIVTAHFEARSHNCWVKVDDLEIRTVTAVSIKKGMENSPPEVTISFHSGDVNIGSPEDENWCEVEPTSIVPQNP